MTQKPRLQSIVEGNTTVLIYIKDEHREKGPGKKQGLSFYNPAMMMNRDISVLVVQYLCDSKKKTVDVLDGMAASGIRGFRFVNEITGMVHVTLNDWDDESFKLISKNAEGFDTDSYQLSQENIHVLFSQNKYDYIDVDPFGSPAIYIDGAIRSIQNNGILAVSATDTATLCGVYPLVCLRRYNAQPLHGSCMHETALRVLIGFIGRQAGKYNKGIQPLLSYSTDHYFRCYLLVRKGVKYADQSINQIYQVPSSSVPYQKDQGLPVGPLWMGYLHDKQFVSNLKQIVSGKKFQTNKKITSLLTVCEQEAMMPAFYYSTTQLSKKWKKSPTPLDDLIAGIQKKGFFVTKTQFDPTGFKSNAPINLIDNIFLELS